MDTGTSYFIVLNNGDTKKLYDISRGHYVLIVNPPMYYDPTIQLIDSKNSTPESPVVIEQVAGKKYEFDLLPTSTDAELTVVITKTNERWLNDSSHNLDQTYVRPEE